jgi:hypothetical protein
MVRVINRVAICGYLLKEFCLPCEEVVQGCFFQPKKKPEQRDLRLVAFIPVNILISYNQTVSSFLVKKKDQIVFRSVK